MIISKVIRKNRAHITRSDYYDCPVFLDSINVKFPQIHSLQARALRRLLHGNTLSHREFDSISSTYCLRGHIGFLRDKGWTVVNHDEMMKTNDIVPRSAKFTRYELFAELSSELQSRSKAFCKKVDDYEGRATSTGK